MVSSLLTPNREPWHPARTDTKIILTGDPYQIDNPYVDSRSNGLVYTRNRLKGQPFVAQVADTEVPVTSAMLVSLSASFCSIFRVATPVATLSVTTATNDTDS